MYIIHPGKQDANSRSHCSCYFGLLKSWMTLNEPRRGSKTGGERGREM